MATAQPETAYGHIAMTEQETASELPQSAKLTVPVRSYAAYKQTVATTETIALSAGTQNTEAIVRTYFQDIPVMAEIARCESGFRHTLSDGSTLTGRVDSADTGVMQINKRYHQSAASAMDLNLDTIYDNMAYARHLYERQGLQPWNASAGCWNRTLASNI